MVLEEFNKYMEEFKTKTLEEKQLLCIDQIKMVTALVNAMCRNLNVDNEILANKEILDMDKVDYTEDDFAEAIMVYINSIQNSLVDLGNRVSDVIDFATTNE